MNENGFTSVKPRIGWANTAAPVGPSVEASQAEWPAPLGDPAVAAAPEEANGKPRARDDDARELSCEVETGLLCCEAPAVSAARLNHGDVLIHMPEHWLPSGELGAGRGNVRQHGEIRVHRMPRLRSTPLRQYSSHRVSSAAPRRSGGELRR
jgi:hypothetical protein